MDILLDILNPVVASSAFLKMQRSKDKHLFLAYSG